MVDKMNKLKCGCLVVKNMFILGEKCRDNGCVECNILVTLHPFGEKRLKEVIG